MGITKPPHTHRFWILGAILLCLAIIPSATGAAPPLEYCGTRKADQQVGAASHPERNRDGRPHVDCTPFIEKKGADEGSRAEEKKPVRPPRDLRIEDLPADVSKFLQEYRQFLDCCKSDPAELERVEELGDEVGDLLRLAQTELFSEQMKLRGMTLKEMIAPVASARRELALLRKQLEQLGALMEKRDASGYEEAGQETLLIQETEEAIQKQAGPHSLPSGAKTGVEIGITPSAGKTIGKTPTSGTAIGAEGLAGPKIGVNPKTGREIGVSGPTGFEIGATGRAGPDIGESTFNSGMSSSVGSSLSPSTIGSSLQDSTVGSSIGTSTTGSSLSDSTIGSSLGGSSVGSSLQNRSTGPQ
ncbi:MAG TPA: hypothetical protein VJ805_08295 [Nitrospiraceae bacterium]|nr:hypothetical protein [Nitrospiraceae bacterium]